VCVNIGGDLRVTGTPPDGTAWRVAVEAEPGDDKATEGSRSMLVLADGGVATTSARRRVWTRGDRVVHHVIDPRTGAPAEVPWGSVTAVAGDAAGAEVAATAAFLTHDADAAAAALAELGAVGIAVDLHDDLHRLGDVDAFLEPRDLVGT
jgi:thiamine biosynthesis lipoprotein